MIQLVAAAALGAVVWVGYSSFKKHMEEQRNKPPKPSELKPMADLEVDPETGRYKPKPIEGNKSDKS